MTIAYAQYGGEPWSAPVEQLAAYFPAQFEAQVPCDDARDNVVELTTPDVRVLRFPPVARCVPSGEMLSYFLKRYDLW